MSRPAAVVKDEPGSSKLEPVTEEEGLDYLESIPLPLTSEYSLSPSVKHELLELEEEMCWDSGSPCHTYDPLELLVDQETCFRLSEGTIVKEELTLGPECVQHPGNYPFSVPLVRRACSVRVARAPALDARVAAAARDPDALFALRFMCCEICKTIMNIDTNNIFNRGPICRNCVPKRALQILQDLLKPIKKVSSKRVKKIYNCEVCKQAFSSFVTYDRHKKEHGWKSLIKKHKGGKRLPEKKTNDDLIVKYIDSVKKIRKNDGVTKPVGVTVAWHCDICREKFTEVEDLKAHKRVHKHARQYSCAVCSKSFSCLKDIKSHRCRKALVQLKSQSKTNV